MAHTVVRTILIEDDPDDVFLLKARLAETPDCAFAITHVPTMAAALALPRGEPVDLLLVDLNLPDSRQMATVHQLHDAMPDTCIVVHTGVRDDELALEATRAGVQEYLVKGDYDGPALRRALRCAVERQSRRVGAVQADKPAVPFYRQFLDDELRRRKAADATYSLRTFALALDLHVANVSKVLAGKQALTLKSAVRAAAALGLEGEVKQRFLASVSAEERSRLIDKQTATVAPHD
jgi:DNA-binding NarL/FixJ family response regulator